MHAFDLDRLAERRIVVRRARAGEKMRTLDGIERALPPEMCVIADAAHAVAIGGVMGGAESEIGFATRNILLESAWFDPISIRRTSKALGLRTEASHALRARRRSGNGRAGLAPLRGADSRTRRRRNPRRRGGRLSRASRAAAASSFRARSCCA